MATTTASTIPTATVTQNEFLQLMVAQLKSQDPLNPTDNSQMLAQLAQFSQLSGIEQLNTSFGELLTLQELTQGTGLIGKKINYNNSSGAATSGTVSAMSMSSGEMTLTVGSDSVQLSQITGVST
jgi:flagellar basal-body rod modification protein FlgD